MRISAWSSHVCSSVLIAFTGSTAVCQRLVATAAVNRMRLTLELGGKSPALVLPDADLDAAIEGISRGIFDNGGQVCVASARVYAHRSVYRDVVDGMAAFGDRLRLGPGLDPAAHPGPPVSVAPAARVGPFPDGGPEHGGDP